MEWISAWRKRQLQMHHRKERVLQVAEAAGDPQGGKRNCVFTVRRRQGRRRGRGNVAYLWCNQIVNGLESEADRVAVNVAGTGFLSRRTAEQIWRSSSLVLSSSFHLPKRRMRTQRGKFPNSPEKLSDGMDEKLM